MEYPAGWTSADESLAPDLFDPREILSVGTFPLRPGGMAPTEAFLPGNAIADIGPDDVFLTLQERVRSLGGSHFPTRPPGFGPGTGCPSGDAACVDGSSMALQGLRAWWIPFSDRPSGRDFYAFVAMGEEAYRDPARSAAGWRVLDSLAFDPEEQLTELPPPIRDDYRSEFVSDERGYRFWPRSGRVERRPLPIRGAPLRARLAGRLRRQLLGTRLRDARPRARLRDQRGHRHDHADRTRSSHVCELDRAADQPVPGRRTDRPPALRLSLRGSVATSP